MMKKIIPVIRTYKIESEIHRLLSEVLSERREMLGLDRGWVLPLDVLETDRDILIIGEAPGMAIDDLLISLHTSRIEFKGLKREDAAPASAKYIRLEREYGAFRRVLALPASVQTDSARATLENGVLTVVLRKLKPTRIKDKVVRIQRGAESGGGKNG
jgi:HSP20 family molecular chaperone IbpA